MWRRLVGPLAIRAASFLIRPEASPSLAIPVKFPRMLLVCALAFGLGAVVPTVDGGVGPGTAAAAKKSTTSTAKSSSKKSKRVARASAKKKRNKKTAKVKLCSTTSSGKGKKSRRKCSFVKEFQGHGVAKASLRTEALPQPSGNIWVHAENLGEEAKVNIYKADGSFDEAALAQLDDIFRCKRTNEVRAVDPRLYEQLSRIQDAFGGKEIELVSGFRFAERNSSRHYHASAMDIRIKGVSIREMYAMAESLDAGGMGIGIYPHSGFIHVDYRAPGEPSYRWTDYSGPGGNKNVAKRSKKPGRTARAKKPTS